MDYSNQELHDLNLLNSQDALSQRFNTPKDVKALTLGILICISIALTVSIVLKVDVIVPAKGILETRQELFSVKTPVEGEVRGLLVVEGQNVAAGDLMMHFDISMINLQEQALRKQLQALNRAIQQNYTQLSGLLTAKELSRLDQLMQDSGQDNTIVASWRDRLLAPIESELAVKQQQLLTIDQQLSKNQRLLQLTERRSEADSTQLNNMQTLYERGMESHRNVQQQQQMVIGNELAIAEYQENSSDLQKQKEGIIIARKQYLDNLVAERLVQLLADLDKHGQIEVEIKQQRLQREKFTIKSPISGKVDQALIKGVGEVVKAGSDLFMLRPRFDQNDLEIDIQIPSSSAVWVEQGMPFRASAQGINPDDHGYISGTVDFVSNSTHTDQQGSRHFRMTGKVDDIDLFSESSDWLRPGLELTVEIKAGKRRLISYLFDPFTKHLRTAFSEPG